MAFKEVTSTKANAYWPKKVAERKVGDEIIGKYIGARQQNTPNGLQDYYALETDDGVTFVRSSAGLKRSMDAVPEGSIVKIIFQGKQTSKTGRQFNAFSVYIDDGDGADEDDVDLDGIDF